MKLLNYNELKTLLLEERDKIPLTVPGARYEMNIPQPNKHGEAMRGGIRIALRCMERCQPIFMEDPRPKGRWVEGYPVTCSICGHSAETLYEDCNIYQAIHTPYCSYCGADMRGGEG